MTKHLFSFRFSVSRRRALRLALIAAAIVTGGAVHAGAVITTSNLVVDGGFELPVVGSGRGFGIGNGIGDFYAPGVPTQYPYLNAGPTIDGVWQVSSGSVEVCGTGYFTPAEGVQGLDLDGTTPGTIYQDIATVPNQSYLLTFDLAGNPDGGPNIKSLQLTAGSASSFYQFNDTGKTDSNPGWTIESLNFVANGPTTRITFASLDPVGNPYGPWLDNIIVSAVPEPSACWLSIPLVTILLKRRSSPQGSAREA